MTDAEYQQQLDERRAQEPGWFEWWAAWHTERIARHHREMAELRELEQRIRSEWP